jgi:steroid 5-alpha reductase family enzyme
MLPREVLQAVGSAAPLILLMVTAFWIASVVRRDASLVDRIWGMGFVVLAWQVGAWARPQGLPVDRWLQVLVALWGIRLSWHITQRNWGHGEDPRYAAMRARNGGRWWWQSFITVFLLQGALMLLIGLPLAAVAAPGARWGRLLGTLLWAIGFAFEAGGDWQLARFKADPSNRGRVLDSGFWRYTRHPNYFGDALQWWGFWCFAAASGLWWTVISPIVMTLLLRKVSGVTLLESALVESKPGYRDYVRRTSAFVPWWPSGR